MENEEPKLPDVRSIGWLGSLAREEPTINPKIAIDPLLSFNGEYLLWPIFKGNNPRRCADSDSVDRGASLLHLVQTRPPLGLQMSRLIASGAKHRGILRTEEKAPRSHAHFEVSGHRLQDGGFRKVGRQPILRGGLAGSRIEPLPRVRNTNYGAKEQEETCRGHGPNENKLSYGRRERASNAVEGK
jgi:hypothetical protein